MKYQYLAGLQESTGEIIYSRARHDFISTTDGLNSVDGGQDYFRQVWDNSKSKPLKQVVIELEISPAQLYDDWNYARNEFGRTSIDKVKIVPENELEDKDSFEYRKKYLMWGTYGKEGKGPRRMIMLATDAETDHLIKILETQGHISGETRKIIESILKDRNETLSNPS